MAGGRDAAATGRPKKDAGRPAAIRVHVLPGAAGQADSSPSRAIPSDHTILLDRSLVWAYTQG